MDTKRNKVYKILLQHENKYSITTIERVLHTIGDKPYMVRVLTKRYFPSFEEAERWARKKKLLDSEL